MIVCSQRGHTINSMNITTLKLIHKSYIHKNAYVTTFAMILGMNQIHVLLKQQQQKCHTIVIVDIHKN